MSDNIFITPAKAKEYVNSGLSVIPIKPDGSKAPPISWKPYQIQFPSEIELDKWFSQKYGIAIVSGLVSGNLEILDIDEPELLEPFKELVKDINPDLIQRLVLVKTPSPGYQFYYRCQAIEGNQKLAVREIEDTNGKIKNEVLFETRGEGGYVVAPPSPPACHPANRPYEILQGNISEIPEITTEERNCLLDCARSFNEKVIQKEEQEINHTRETNRLRPGDDYNANFSSSDWFKLLTEHGWKRRTRKGEVEYWQKPDKKGTGISATLNHRGSNLLYVFSTSAYPLEPERAYTAFAAYTFLEHSGDFKKAAGELEKKGYGEKLSSQTYSNQFEQLSNELKEHSSSILAKAPLTDAGNAECMEALYKNQICYDNTRQKWLTWDGVKWNLDNRGFVQRLTVSMARLRQRIASEIENYESYKQITQWAISSESHNRVTTTLKMSQVLESFSRNIDEFDKNPYLIATKNGTLDLQTITFRNSRAEDYLTKQLGCEYILNAKANRWEQFLSEIFGDDEELIDYIQRAVGYSLTGDTREQVLFLCHGSGANGKSVFLDVIKQILGDYAGSASFETFDAGNRNAASNDLAALKGKRFVTVIETEEDRRLAEAKVKLVTGGDEVSCRFLYGEFFTYRPQFKIWFAMNHKPDIRGMDNGIWRRIRLIPFTKSFEGHNDDKSLREKLLKELPGILNWALEGLRKWKSDGLTTPEAVKKATDEYRRDSDTIAQWVEDRTHPFPVNKLRAGEAYRNYSQWVLEQGKRPYSQVKWGQSLVEKGYEKGRDNQGYFYLGLELRP